MKSIFAFLNELFPEPSRERIFLVGGTVRDILLGQENKDIDLIAALPEHELHAIGFRLVEGKSTTPIWFRHDNEFGKIELTALANADGLAADLARRDFTVNAVAMDLTGEIIDPLGGMRDLEERQLRVCSPPSFLDDPLRIFRAFRFEADGWRMAPESGALIRERDWSQQLAAIPVERFSREMLKALELPEPARFFQLMLENRAGEKWLPEIFRMPHIPAGPLEHHPEGDLFTHSIQVLERVAKRSNDPLARFCALFHDIGKLATIPADYPKHHGHDAAGFNLACSLCDRLRLPAEYRTALAWTSRLHGTLNRWAELRGATRVRLAEQALKARISATLPLVCMADKGVDEVITGWANAVRIAGMSATDLGIDLTRLETLAAGNRPDLILQKRVEMLRRV